MLHASDEVAGESQTCVDSHYVTAFPSAPMLTQIPLQLRQMHAGGYRSGMLVAQTLITRTEAKGAL